MWHARGAEVMPLAEHPDLPDYGGACISNVVPALLGPAAPIGCRPGCPSRWPAPTRSCCSCSTASAGSSSRSGRHLAPTLAGMAGGADPHGRAVDHGHRAHLDRHRPAAGRARRRRLPHRGRRRGPERAALDHAGRRRPPARAAARAPARSPPFLRRNVRRSSPRPSSPAPASRCAHLARRPPRRLADAVDAGRRGPARCSRAGEPFVYAYYDGIDKVAHEYGLGEYYDAELVAADRLVADLLEALPAGAALVVTADHGQVDVGDNVVALAPDVRALVALQSGEGRFRWLHAVPGHGAERCSRRRPRRHGDLAWVRQPSSRSSTRAGSGPLVTPAAAGRLGDVALVARDADRLRRPGRHRALRSWSAGTARSPSAEMLVPLARRPSLTPSSARHAPGGPTDVRSEPADPTPTPSSTRADRPGEPPPTSRASRRSRRVGRAAGQGHADRLDGEAAARRGAPAALDEPAATGSGRSTRRRSTSSAKALSPDLQDELRPPGPAVRRRRRPSEAELRVAQAQLVGWLEGLFHGIQATLFAQQMAARQQLEQLPPAAARASGRPSPSAPARTSAARLRSPAPTSGRRSEPRRHGPRRERSAERSHESVGITLLSFVHRLWT